MKRSLAWILLAGTTVMAHPGHDHGAVSGLIHPLTGLDHLAAMIAVGVWAASRSSRLSLWVLPAAFASSLLVGILLPVVGIFAEVGIVMSMVGLAGLLLRPKSMPNALAVGIAAGCGLVHGLAHGMELQGSITTFAIGATLSTFALHMAGAWMGIMRTKQSLRWATAATLLAMATVQGIQLL